MPNIMRGCYGHAKRLAAKLPPRVLKTSVQDDGRRTKLKTFLWSGATPRPLRASARISRAPRGKRIGSISLTKDEEWQDPGRPRSCGKAQKKNQRGGIDSWGVNDARHALEIPKY